MSEPPRSIAEAIQHARKYQLFGSTDPSKAKTARKHFAQAVESQHTPVQVHGEERLEWWRAIGKTRWKLQIPVRIVFNDQKIVLLCQFVNGLLSLRGHRSAGGILTSGDGVERLYTTNPSETLSKKRFHQVKLTLGFFGNDSNVFWSSSGMIPC